MKESTLSKKSGALPQDTFFDTNKLTEVVRKKSKLKQKIQSIREKTEDFIDNSIVIGILGVITIWALLSDDIRQLTANKQADIGFDVVTFVVFTLFMIECLLSVWAKPGYFPG